MSKNSCTQKHISCPKGKATEDKKALHREIVQKENCITQVSEWRNKEAGGNFFKRNHYSTGIKSTA